MVLLHDVMRLSKTAANAPQAQNPPEDEPVLLKLKTHHRRWAYAPQAQNPP